MTADPRTEEIRARLAAATPAPWTQDAVYIVGDGIPGGRPRGEVIAQARPTLGHWPEYTDAMRRSNAALIANAPADLAYLLGRIEALEGENARLGRRVGMTKQNAADDLAELRAERDRYRDESDCYRELWEQKCAEVEANDALVTAAREWRRVEDLVATSDEYRGSDKAIVAGNFLLADARSALLAALAALDGGEGE